ncbi:hypothetical protein PINS_up012376 [Pythium insidiosum]|nr:hypothetical protein PINS_up012376 [Pythium insidiosum]
MGEGGDGMSPGDAKPPSTQAAPDGESLQESDYSVDDRDVQVWVRDVNGMVYGVTLPISSTFDDVLKEVHQQHGPIPGVVVGFEGGKNVHTTISEVLPSNPPADFDEALYLFQHPIQPKFKRECVIL